MKSIEERAYEYALKAHPYEPFFSYWEKVYLEIATEQRAIDEKEYTEEMRHLNEEWKANLDIQRAMLIEKACEWLQAYDITFTQTPSMLEDFKRAMEEV